MEGRALPLRPLGASLMNRVIVILAAVLLALPSARGQGPSEEAMSLATKLTKEGAATFDTKDAKAMAASYTEDAQVGLVGKDQDKGGYKLTAYKGRAEIEKLYEDIFKDAEEIHSKNTVDYARLLQPDLLLIAGTFEVSKKGSEPAKFPFVQVRFKQGDSW